MNKFNNKETHPNHLSQTILNRLLGRVLKKEGTRESRHAEFISASQFVILRCQRHSPIRYWYNFKASLRVAKNLKSITPHPSPLPQGAREQKAAFTLAEVLITLGIIGVVAALVIPGVINNFKIKELESRFKKTDATVTKALYSALNELDLDVEYINDRTTPSDMFETEGKARADEINSVWMKQFPGAKEFNSCKHIAKCHGFGMTTSAIANQCLVHGPYSECYWYRPHSGFILPDGAYISRVYSQPNSQVWLLGPGGKGTILYIYFDTNGPFKGPNALGYDWFMYTTSINKIWYGCDPFGGGTYGSFGCIWSARRDQNPYDNSISYWKSLSKPKSWWEKLRNNK